MKISRRRVKYLRISTCFGLAWGAALVAFNYWMMPSHKLNDNGKGMSLFIETTNWPTWWRTNWLLDSAVLFATGVIMAFIEVRVMMERPEDDVKATALSMTLFASIMMSSFLAMICAIFGGWFFAVETAVMTFVLVWLFSLVFVLSGFYRGFVPLVGRLRSFFNADGVPEEPNT